jgi:hypothetical protein
LFQYKNRPKTQNIAYVKRADILFLLKNNFMSKIEENFTRKICNWIFDNKTTDEINEFI